MADLREVPANFLRGAAMGSADIVPGVSGGTVALVLAIYHRLIVAIRTGSSALGRLLRLDVRGALGLLREIEWLFLVPLGAGILTAVLLLASTIEHQLEEHPVQMAGLFLGLVAGAALVAMGLLTRRDAREWGLIAGSGAGFFLLLGLTDSALAARAVGEVPAWQFFLSGAIAICAMILPGVSGSFLLVAMGMYQPVLAAVTSRDYASLAVFLLGCVVGLALFSQLLHWALSEHYDTVMALMIGLLVGSLRILWPWPDGGNSVELGRPDEAVAVTVLLAVVGFVVVLVVDRVAHRLENRTPSDEAEELRAS
jgi:putative membrane protein